MSDEIFVTISRQAGAGGITIGELLAKNLNKEIPGKSPWTVFDKNLVKEVVWDNNLSDKAIPFLKEEIIPLKESAMDTIINYRSSQSVMVDKTNQTMLHLSRMGRVILVGRGASSVTRSTPGGTHVRLVAPYKKRLEHIKEYYHLTQKEAKGFIEKEDRGRADYLKKYFGLNIDDPLLYDLIINTENFSFQDVSMLITDLVLRRRKGLKSITKKEKVNV